MSVYDVFEDSIQSWGLAFKEAESEERYKKGRREFKTITGQVLYFMIVVVVVVVLLITLDILGAVFSPNYSLSLYDFLIYLLYLPLGILEYIIFRFPKLYKFRGAVATVILYFMLFSSTMIPYSKKLDYPAVSPTVLLWYVGMYFLHIFYVDGWIVSLYIYIVVYIEILGIIFYTFGEKFIENGILAAIFDSFYYIILFGAFSGFTVFALRTYEKRERASFFSQLNSENEMECWKTLLNDLPEPVILSREGLLTFCNTATHRFLLGGSAGQLSDTEILEKLDGVVQNLAEQNKPSLRDSIREYVSMPSEDGISKYYTYRCNRKVLKVEVKGVQIVTKDSGRIIQHILHDITALEDLEHEKAKRDCLEILVATASHDIRTPLNAIQGSIDNLEGCPLIFEAQIHLSVLHKAVKRLSLYVRGLAYLEHIETKTLQIDLKTFDVPQSIKEMLVYFDITTKAKKLIVQTIVCSHIPLINSDKDKYDTIIYHLLENAFKYTFKGEVTITLSYSSESSFLATQIKDTGIGMKTGYERELFNLFSRKRKRDEMNPQGMGLGLHMAKSLTKELGGVLAINSEPNSGTTVTFTIKHVSPTELTEPMTETDVMLDGFNDRREYQTKPMPNMVNFVADMAERIDKINQKENRILNESERELMETNRIEVSSGILSQARTNDCSCNRVLIVDDESTNLYVLENFLSGMKYQSDIANNGKEAIEMIKNRISTCHHCKGYKLVLMDINMPVMDGVNAMKAISNLIEKNEIPPVPVLAVTAAAHLEDKNTCREYKKLGFVNICTFLLD